MTDNCICDCCIYSLSSELLLLLGLFCSDGLQFSLHFSDYFTFFFFLSCSFPGFLLLLLPLQAFKFFSFLVIISFLFCHFSMSIYFISSSSFSFSFFFCYSVQTPSCTKYWTSTPTTSFSKFSSFTPASPSYSLN